MTFTNALLTIQRLCDHQEDEMYRSLSGSQVASVGFHATNGNEKHHFISLGLFHDSTSSVLMLKPSNGHRSTQHLSIRGLEPSHKPRRLHMWGSGAPSGRLKEVGELSVVLSSSSRALPLT